jgi:hypothetical protein
LDQGSINIWFFDQLNGFATIVGYSGRLHITAFLDNAPQPGTHDAVVICQ